MVILAIRTGLGILPLRIPPPGSDERSEFNANAAKPGVAVVPGSVGAPSSRRTGAEACATRFTVLVGD